MNNTYYSDIGYVMINNKAPRASITITYGEDYVQISRSTIQ
ncbi:MAG: hypothetical protein QXK74_01895 [Candidatus Nitrosocaldaceae archaeon]